MEKEIFKKANFFKQFKILNVQNNEENIENFLIGFLVLLVNIFFIFIDNGELNTKIILILLIFNFFSIFFIVILGIKNSNIFVTFEKCFYPKEFKDIFEIVIINHYSSNELNQFREWVRNDKISVVELYNTIIENNEIKEKILLKVRKRLKENILKEANNIKSLKKIKN